MASRLTLFILLYLCCLTFVRAEPLVLAMPHFPPFTYLDEWGNPAGIGYQKVKQTLDKAGIDFRVEAVPNYGRALAETRRGNVDGFFIASQNDERDTVAEFSGRLMDNPWSWYYWRNNHQELCQQTITTIMNTNTHRWLKSQQCPQIKPSNTPDELVHLLLKQKVSAVFIAQVVMHKALLNAGLSQDYFAERVEINKPVGIYISHQKLKQSPALMSRIQRVIQTDTQAAQQTPTRTQ